MSDVPKVESVSTADDYARIAEAMSQRIAALPPTDYDKLYVELSQLNVKVSDDPSLQNLSNELQRIQGAKDRAAEIVNNAIQNFFVRKRITEILQKGWIRFSDAGSADKREAEAMLKLSQFIVAAAEAESFYRAALQILENLDSQHEIVSRRISCYNLALKLRDLRGYGSDLDSIMKTVSPSQPGFAETEAYDQSLSNWDKLES